MSLLVVEAARDASEVIRNFLSRNWGICGIYHLKVFIVESSSRKYNEMHSQSQLKPSYKVTIFCTDKGKILKVTPTTTPTLTKLQFCTWETNVKDLHVCVWYFGYVCVCRLSVECNWNPWQHNASQLLHGGSRRRWREEVNKEKNRKRRREQTDRETPPTPMWPTKTIFPALLLRRSETGKWITSGLK